jgi:hypothetical protein
MNALLRLQLKLSVASDNTGDPAFVPMCKALEAEADAAETPRRLRRAIRRALKDARTANTAARLHDELEFENPPFEAWS